MLKSDWPELRFGTFYKADQEKDTHRIVRRKSLHWIVRMMCSTFSHRMKGQSTHRFSCFMNIGTNLFTSRLSYEYNTSDDYKNLNKQGIYKGI